MELSPRSSRRIQESTGSSSSELQPFIILDDRSILHVQDEISALEQQQQLLCDCKKEQVCLQNEIRVLQQFVDSSGMHWQQLEDDTSMNATQLNTCFEGKGNKEIENTILEVAAQHITEHLERFETLERLQRTKMAILSKQFEALETENILIRIKLQKADQEAEALGKEIKNLETQLVEQGNCRKEKHIPSI